MKWDQALGLHPQALVLRSRRAEILSSNLANADTPGFKARDFDFQKILRGEMPAPERLAVTDSGHIQPQYGVVPAAQMLYRVPHQSSLDGNTVDAQREYAQFSSNSLSYQASLQLLSNKFKGLMSAIKGQ